jgi:hypothetical protein
MSRRGIVKPTNELLRLEHKVAQFCIVARISKTSGMRANQQFAMHTLFRHLILDRDKKFGWEVITAIRSAQMSPLRTSFQSPWQNGIAERWVESCRRDILDRVIALNEAHLKRLLRDYVAYYHEDRTHLGLGRNAPNAGFRQQDVGVPHHCHGSAGYIIATNAPRSFRKGHTLFARAQRLAREVLLFKPWAHPFKRYDTILRFFR